jgi:tetratricopeptide (TPR) repeat protein
MNAHSYIGATRAVRALRLLFAACICLAFAGCASNVTRRETAATPTAVTQPIDQTRRNRQFQHAEALYLSGHLKEATAAFEELTHTYPNDPRIWLKYGNTLTKQGSYEEAAKAFQTALSLDPEQGGAALNLALVRLGQAQAALDVASARLAANSAEHEQAEALQRQLKTLLGTPDRGASSH